MFQSNDEMVEFPCSLRYTATAKFTHYIYLFNICGFNTYDFLSQDPPA